MLTQTGEHWQPLDAHLAQWVALYPALDVSRELAQMAAWLDANPRRRKTARGMPRFCLAWLTRSAALPAPAAPVPHVPWSCRHLEPCDHRAMCAIKAALPQKYPERNTANT